MKVIVTSNEVKYPVTRRGRCPVCGATVARTRSFAQTITPWNRLIDGTVRDFAEIRRQLHAEAETWQPDFTHERCLS